MASSTLLLFSALALIASQTSATDHISQISDGQIQAGLSTIAPSETIGLESTSTTSKTFTTSALIPVTAINATAAVTALSSTTGSVLPTSILLAALPGAPGAESNYTGLRTVAGGPFPTPHVPIPLNGTAMPTLGAFSGTGAAATSGLTTLTPAGSSAEGESPTSTSTEQPVAATGAAVKIGGAAIRKGLIVAGMVTWIFGVL